jgi:transcriptional regulator GlxA family with amidase domain
VFVAAPGVEILDLVGPLQVFARASEMHIRENPGSPPIYSVEVVTISARRSLVANCGLRIAADRTLREVRGKIDTLLVAGGDAVEQNEINPEAVRWLKKISPRIRRVGRFALAQCYWPEPGCSMAGVPRLIGTGVTL